MKENFNQNPRGDTSPQTATARQTRSQNVTLPADAAEASAQVLAYVRGDATFSPAPALEAMRERVAQLIDPTAPDSLEELARQLPTLEALWLRFAAEAVAAFDTDAKAKSLRMALQAQQAYARTFTLLRGLALQKQGLAQVVIED